MSEPPSDPPPQKNDPPLTRLWQLGQSSQSGAPLPEPLPAPHAEPLPAPPPLPPPILNYATPAGPAGPGFAAGFLLSFVTLLVAGVMAAVLFVYDFVSLGWAVLIVALAVLLIWAISHRIQGNLKAFKGMLAGVLILVLGGALAFGLCMAILAVALGGGVH